MAVKLDTSIPSGVGHFKINDIQQDRQDYLMIPNNVTQEVSIRTKTQGLRSMTDMVLSIEATHFSQWTDENDVAFASYEDLLDALAESFIFS